MTGGTARPTPDMVGTTVFITGANGFIGRAVARRFRELGARVRGVDLIANPTDDVVAGDITEPHAWATALAGSDLVVHTAALLGAAYPLRDSWRVNVLGTSRVLDAAVAAGVPRFVHFSSVAAYGFAFPDNVDETYPVRVNGDVYTDTKVNSEAVVLAAHAAGRIEARIVRPGDVWGPGSVWVRSPIAEMRKPTGFPLPDGGTGIFSPVYIDNFVDGLTLVATSDRSAGQIYNITDGIAVPCSEFFGHLARMSNGRVRTLPMRLAAPLADLVGAVLRRTGNPTDLSAGTMGLLNRNAGYSIDKIRTELGYQPQVSIDEGMASVETWARGEGLIPS
ncbi:NAD-dependent epimerase/dehydratase family protein [Nocardia alba]|uniref:Nucleoside-diphosphate-sugar epimerase n=1 Tax=Nocardia alba TaxID=225051 RepID=A0A4R1FGT8_9NOCA|nr:NAD-dependent epimerase/dehydratase family protein [Nocardia alba]TCJ93573.1 nucleoside-diphosphate-sugar epimerase [Nocardia alba]